MEEQKRVARQALERDLDDISSAREPRVSVSYAPLGLKPLGP
jgi:hypothetical protein